MATEKNRSVHRKDDGGKKVSTPPNRDIRGEWPVDIPPATDKPVDKPTDKPTGKPTDKPTDK